MRSKDAGPGFFTGGCDQLIIRTNERRRRSLLGGSGGMPPREILKIKLSDCISCVLKVSMIAI